LIKLCGVSLALIVGNHPRLGSRKFMTTTPLGTSGKPSVKDYVDLSILIQLLKAFNKIDSKIDNFTTKMENDNKEFITKYKKDIKEFITKMKNNNKESITKMEKDYKEFITKIDAENKETNKKISEINNNIKVGMSTFLVICSFLSVLGITNLGNFITAVKGLLGL
jgi:vacuolar-type H+-ATPase subunit H